MDPTSSHIPRPTGSGTIPDCIGSDLTSLEWLELQQNKLDGTIPQSLCLIGDSLTHLDLYDNDLTGECVELYAVRVGWTISSRVRAPFCRPAPKRVPTVAAAVARRRA